MRVVRIASPWAKEEVEKLITLVRESMEEQGSIDPILLGKMFNRSPSAVKCKLSFEGVHYVCKSPKGENHLEQKREDDTRSMPKHTKGDLKGRSVDYMRSWKL